MPVSPPRPKGPPLNALRAFEAAARLGGFAAAAQELCVTPAAVAQQIKVLEEWAGDHLFVRRSQGVQLSALGQHVISDFSTAFDRLGEATLALRLRAMPKSVRIAALPSVAQLWLSPRLPTVRSATPDLTVSVTALETPPNLKREHFDMAIFYEDLPVSAHSVVLCQDIIYPVCTPAMAAELKRASDLADVHFVHDEAWRDDWEVWLASAAPKLTVATEGASFSLYALAVEETKNGVGVLIGHDALVRSLVERGTLAVPFKRRVKRHRALTIRLADKSLSNPVIDGVVAKLTSLK